MIGYIKRNYSLILIVILAIFLRFYKMGDYMEFLGDQGRDAVIIRNFLKNFDLFFIGPQTSIGNMYLGPYFYYFISPFLWLFNFNPLGLAFFSGIIGILTLILAYKITDKWFGNKVAIFVTILYAISPVVIKYTSFSWNPNIMPFFALLFIYFLGKFYFNDCFKCLIYLTISFIMAINSHYLALLLIPIAFIYWLIKVIFLKNNHPSKLNGLLIFTIISVVIFVISLTPQILFDIKHHGQNIGAISQFFTKRETTLNLKVYKAVPNLWPIFVQINTSLLTGRDKFFGEILSIILLISTIITTCGLFKNKSSKFKYYLLILIWYLVGLVGLGLYKQHLYDHYFGFLFPCVFIYAVFTLYYLSKKFALLKTLSLIIFIICTYLSIKQNQLFFNSPNQLTRTQKIANSIYQESDNKAFNLALIAKQNYDPPYRYFLYEQNAPIYDLNTKKTDQLFVICEPHPDINCNPINHPQWEIAAFGWVKIDKQWQIDGIQIYKLIPNIAGN